MFQLYAFIGLVEQELNWIESKTKKSYMLKIEHSKSIDMKP